MKIHLTLFILVAGLFLPAPLLSETNIPQEKLDAWFLRFPDADLNGDAKLSAEEAMEYRKRRRSGSTAQGGAKGRQWGAPQEFEVDPGWATGSFPETAVSYRTPEEIRDLYAGMVGQEDAIVSFPKPSDGSLRIIGTGHSFMMPGYSVLSQIAKGTASQQEIYTHSGGGITGSARYKWEEENGIFQFDGEPKPKLLASLANAEWDVMTWGPYFHDQPAYYACWIEFALKHQPEMRFYLSDAWPQLYQLEEEPSSEAELTYEVFQKMNDEREVFYNDIIEALRKDYGDRIFILPTNRAFTLLAQRHLVDPLPGVEGIHRSIGGKERSIWRDTLGHMGNGFERLEGYVFYATLYGKNPASLPTDLPFRDYDGFPGAELDLIFREIAWEAVQAHSLSGIPSDSVEAAE